MATAGSIDGHCWIGGRVRHGTSGERWDVVDPSSGRSMQAVQLAGPADVAAAADLVTDQGPLISSRLTASVWTRDVFRAQRAACFRAQRAACEIRAGCHRTVFTAPSVPRR